MGAPIENIKIWTDITADMIIDVRSPAEFEEDHIPGAINMPVLDNEQCSIEVWNLIVCLFYKICYKNFIHARSVRRTATYIDFFPS